MSRAELTQARRVLPDTPYWRHLFESHGIGIVWQGPPTAFRPISPRDEPSFENIPQGKAPSGKKPYVPSGRPAPLGFQRAAFGRIFLALNPTEAIPGDFADYLDSSVTLPENRVLLAKQFPTYRWYPTSETSARAEMKADREIEAEWVTYQRDQGVAS